MNKKQAIREANRISKKTGDDVFVVFIECYNGVREYDVADSFEIDMYNRHNIIYCTGD